MIMRDVEEELEKRKVRLVEVMADDIASQMGHRVSPQELLDSDARKEIEWSVRLLYNEIPPFDLRCAVVSEVNPQLSVEGILCGFKRGCVAAQMSPSIEIVGIAIPGEIKEVDEQYKRELSLREKMGSLTGRHIERTAIRRVLKEVTGQYIVFSSSHAYETFKGDLPHAESTWRDNLFTGRNGRIGSINYGIVSVDEINRRVSGKGRDTLYSIFLRGEAQSYTGDKLSEIMRKAEEAVTPFRNNIIEGEIVYLTEKFSR